MGTINQFIGEHRFLSNFYESEMEYRGRTFKTAEHAYQWSKAVLSSDRDRILNAPTPGIAKRIGKSITILDIWDNIKVDVMFDILYAKFTQNKELEERLINTYGARLIEGNDWGDKFWGMYNGKGKNILGNLLTLIRNLLLDKEILKKNLKI